MSETIKSGQLNSPVTFIPQPLKQQPQEEEKLTENIRTEKRKNKAELEEKIASRFKAELERIQKENQLKQQTKS